MSNSLESLRSKIATATDLQTVVRSMKSLAAANIGQYEKSVLAVNDYARTVELGLSVCLHRQRRKVNPAGQPVRSGETRAIVFGSDQGLVGQFNGIVTDFAAHTLAELPGIHKVWAVGERVHSSLSEVGLAPVATFPVPASVGAITSLVGDILIETQTRIAIEGNPALYLFYNSPQAGSLYRPRGLRLLPLDQLWQQTVLQINWPTINLPEVVGENDETLRLLVDEYLFVSLFRACAESLSSENASRLAAMQRADKNIDDGIVVLRQTFNRQRQSSIDEEMFDVIAGFESQTGVKTK